MDLPSASFYKGGTTLYFKVSPYFTGEIGSYLLAMTITRAAISVNTYTFTGTGNWNNAANWSGNLMPPQTLPIGKEIIIQPQAGGECILNVAQTVSAGAKLTDKPNARLRIVQGLSIQKQ